MCPSSGEKDTQVTFLIFDLTTFISHISCKYEDVLFADFNGCFSSFWGGGWVSVADPRFLEGTHGNRSVPSKKIGTKGTGHTGVIVHFGF